MTDAFDAVFGDTRGGGTKRFLEGYVSTPEGLAEFFSNFNLFQELDICRRISEEGSLLWSVDGGTYTIDAAGLSHALADELDPALVKRVGHQRIALWRQAVGRPEDTA